MKTDFLLIGGGVVGCATAYFLAKRGCQVTLLEKGAGVGLQASGRCGCGVRQQGRTAALPLAMAAVRLWGTLSAELNCELEYTRVGNLKIAFSEARLAELEQEMEWEHAHGLAEVRMITPAECQALVPGLTERTLAGKFCPTDGLANPMRVTPAFARAAARLGAQIRTRTAVTGLLLQGSRVCGVTTEAGEIEALNVVNCAGPWAGRFNEMAGCRTPILPGMSQILVTERQPYRRLPFTSIQNAGYILQAMSGNVLLGIEGKPNITYRTAVDHPDLELKAKQLIEAVPWLGELHFLRAFSGITEYTPDKEPYIGAVPSVAGYYTAAGFHGQGFCLGPMVGKLMAELLLGEEPEVSLAPFAPERFAAGEQPIATPSSELQSKDSDA
jgi:sarcosine oxidase subunit beta